MGSRSRDGDNFLLAVDVASTLCIGVCVATKLIRAALGQKSIKWCSAVAGETMGSSALHAASARQGTWAPDP